MPLDIEQTKDHLVVKASLPGVKLEDVDISISGGVLTIKGEIKEEEETKEAEYVCRERFSHTCAAFSPSHHNCARTCYTSTLPVGEAEAEEESALVPNFEHARAISPFWLSLG